MDRIKTTKAILLKNRSFGFHQILMFKTNLSSLYFFKLAKPTTMKI